MGRFNLVRNSFLGGEIGPKSWGRTDMPQWNHSHERLENFLSLTPGSGVRRPGFRFVKQTNNNKVAACYPFAFSDTESYVLEISTPASGNSVIKIIDATDFTEYSVSSGSSLVPLYDASDLDNLQVVQKADVVWIVHADYTPILLVRTSGPSFAVDLAIQPNLAAASFGYTKFAKYQPFRAVNVTGTYFDPSATTGNITVNAETSGAVAVYFFETGMIGSYYKLTQTVGGNQYTGMFQITGMSGAASGGKYATCTATVLDTFGDTSHSADWEECSWSDYRGWPRSVGLFEGRVYYGGNRSEPDRTWASEDAAFFNMDARGQSAGSGFPSQTASSPYSFTPNSGDLNLIEFLSAGKTLFAGTSQREFVCSGPDASQSMSVENISMSPETAHGSRYAQAQRVAYTVIAIQPTGRKIREYVFDFISNSYEGTDISLHASHLLANKAGRICWQEEPNGILWVKDDEGGLCSVTRERQQQIIAWNRHSIGGTDAIVKSICVVPDEDGVKRLFAIIFRTINGADYYSLECLADQYSGEQLTATLSNCLDGHKHGTNGTAQAVWTNFAPHLVGETVRVVAAETSGALPNYEGEFTVGSGGTITLNRAVKEIMVGVKYKTKIKTLKADGGSQIGSAQGAMKRTDKILLRLFDTYGLSYGTSDSNQKEILFWDSNSPGLVQPFTGDKFLEFPNGWDRDGQVQLESEWPFPMGINFIATRMTVNETG